VAVGESDRRSQAAAQLVSDDELKAVATRICASRGFTYSKTLGHGAFKETYLVADKAGGQFALKVVRASADPARVGREIDAMIRCKHPSISVLHACDLETVENRTYCWLLEEYLGGGTLADKLNAAGVLQIDEVKRLGGIFISALEYLRSMSLVHRDIKPENIMFRADGVTPVLVDFGLVRDLGDESLTHTWLVQGPGTPFYAAPEQLQNRKELIDWRTDQFSLGVVLGVCGFGRHPFAEVHEPKPRTVQKVIERGKATDEFVAWAKQQSLEALARMTAAWPVHRFRTPDLLRKAWG
jgi:serine/threonine protein kinase